MPSTTYRQAVRLAIKEALTRDPRVFVLGEDVRRPWTDGLNDSLLAEFGPERIRETPWADSALIGAGIGAALGGMRPIIEIVTSTSSLLALEHIVTHAATIRHVSGGQFSVPLVVRIVTGSHGNRAHSLESWYARVPGVRVLAPATVEDARGMLWTALQDPDPVVIFEYQKLFAIESRLAQNAGPVDIRNAAIRRTGRAVTLIAYGASLGKTAAAAESLAAEEIDAEVLDLRTLRPLDVAAIVKSVKKTHRVVVVDDDWKAGSLSAEIAAGIVEHAFDALEAPIARVSGAEVPLPYPKHLEDAALPQVDAIIEAARQTVG